MNQQADMFILEPAKEQKNLAIKQVADNAGDWMDQALSAMRFLSKRREWTGEDIRLTLETIVGSPHHHNAWGALTKMALQAKLIIPTGRYVPMKTGKSHARKTPVYRRSL